MNANHGRLEPYEGIKPEVKVVIGRVEVRAVVQPEKKVERPAENSPKISLKDYLRSGGNL